MAGPQRDPCSAPRDSVSAPDDTPKPSARRWALPVAATVAGVAVLVVLLRPYGHEIRNATNSTSVLMLAALAGLSLLALIVRTEMWRVALAASGASVPRTQLHAANAGTFLVSLVNGYVAPAVKIWLLRRMRGSQEPRVAQLVVTDFAAALLEVLVAGALVVAAAFVVDLPTWVPVLLVGGGVVATIAAFATHRRWEHHPAVQGLNVVVHSYYRYRLLGLLAVVFVSQIFRTWLALDVVGLDASLSGATLIFVLTGVLGALPTGLAAAPTTASVLVFGRDSVGAAAAAGVLVTVSLFVATIVYTAVVAAVYVATRRRELRTADAAPPDSSSPRRPAGQRATARET